MSMGCRNMNAGMHACGLSPLFFFSHDRVFLVGLAGLRCSFAAIGASETLFGRYHVVLYTFGSAAIPTCKRSKLLHTFFGI